MKYEEVYNASIPVWSWDRTWVSDKTNRIHCKVRTRIRTDVSPCTDGEVLLFFQVRADKPLPVTAWKEPEWQSELRCYPDLGHCFSAHTRPALPSFAARRLRSSRCHSRGLEAPRPGPCSSAFAKHQSRSLNVRRENALSLSIVWPLPGLPWNGRGSPYFRGYCKCCGGIGAAEWMSVRLLLGVLRDKSRVFSNQPWVSDHSHPRVPTSHREQDNGAVVKPPNPSSASPAGVVLTRSDLCGGFFCLILLNTLVFVKKIK